MIKNIVSAFICLMLFFSCATTKQSNKPDYKQVPDSTTKVLRGIVNRQILANDPSFPWFKENARYGEADISAVAALKKNGAKCTFVVLFGTWCHDSQNLVPKFFRLMDAGGIPDSKITLVALDRNKTTVQNLHKVYQLKAVPTFIVLVDGKEVGRVLEHGKTGYMEKELGEIVAKLPI
jgi:thiol-disulfide isomerase/thioredoxin